MRATIVLRYSITTPASHHTCSHCDRRAGSRRRPGGRREPAAAGRPALSATSGPHGETAADRAAAWAAARAAITACRAAPAVGDRGVAACVASVPSTAGATPRPRAPPSGGRIL